MCRFLKIYGLGPWWKRPFAFKYILHKLWTAQDFLGQSSVLKTADRIRDGFGNVFTMKWLVMTLLSQSGTLLRDSFLPTASEARDKWNSGILGDSFLENSRQFFVKCYVVGTRLNRPIEAILKSTKWHGFVRPKNRYISKLSPHFSLYLLLRWHISLIGIHYHCSDIIQFSIVQKNFLFAIMS